MKSYKILLKEKMGKNKSIEYLMANSTENATTLAKQKFPQMHVLEVTLDRYSIFQFYCNRCNREVNYTDAVLHNH